MNLRDPFEAGIDVSEERVNGAFARTVKIIEEPSTTRIRPGRTPLASSLVAVFVLLLLLSFLVCVFWLTIPRLLLVPIAVVIIGVPALLSTREELIVTTSGITLRSILWPMRKAVTIPRECVTSVRVEAFIDSPWDPHVAIVTKDRTFRFAAGLSEAASHEVVRAVRKRLSAG